MDNKKIKRPLIKSFACAFRGIYVAFKSERSFRIHVLALVLAVAAGFFLYLSVLEWCLVVFAAGFVLAAELFNTMIERLSDEISDGKRSETIRNVKDISAAAVGISALTALVVGILVLIIPLIRKLLE
jgi:undecaprenol kinase